MSTKFSGHAERASEKNSLTLHNGYKTNFFNGCKKKNSLACAMASTLRQLIRRGANKRVIEYFNSARKNPVLASHYSVAHLVDHAVQLHSIGDNDVFASPAEANLENLQQCGLTRVGAEKFLKRQQQTEEKRLYKEVAAYLLRRNALEPVAKERAVHDGSASDNCHRS